MATLEKLATTALQKHNDEIEKALPHFLKAVTAAKLIDDLAREYLRTIVGRGVGQGILETHLLDADPMPPSPAIGSIKVREHDVRQHRRRTQAEKEAAEKAMLASADAVFELLINGRAIGNIAIGEMISLKHELFDSAADYITLGVEQVRNGILAELIEHHCGVVPDQLARVREVISAETLAMLVEQARQQTPDRLRIGKHAGVAAMEQHRLKEITV
jgi:hypothetical protein